MMTIRSPLPCHALISISRPKTAIAIALWAAISLGRRRIVGIERLPIRTCLSDAIVSKCVRRIMTACGDRSIPTPSVSCLHGGTDGGHGSYALVAGLIVYILLHLLLKHKRVHEQLLEERLRIQEMEKAERAKVRFFTDVNKEIKAPLLQLQASVDSQQLPHVQQMLQIIDKYSDKYCIDTGRDNRSREIDKHMDRLTRLIDERMADHINIDELAREMGMSRRKLFNFVKDNTGKSIIEYIRSYRLSYAAKLLLEQNLTTLQVMDRVGIDSQSYFVKAFKQEFGDTPTDFIAKMSKKNAE